MTRDAFMHEYRRRLLTSDAPWVKKHGNQAVEKFLSDARSTLETEANLWSIGPLAAASWHAIGGKGRCTLKILRGLPGTDA